MKKLNVGCGGNILEGWENRDSDLDITKPLPFSDGEIDSILAEHVVEHVTHIEALLFLGECARVLRKGGVLRVCIPVLERLSPAHAADIIRGHGHKAAYTETLVAEMIRVAGFDSWRKTGRDPIDGHWKVIGEQKDDLETCRMEAIK